MAYIGKKPTDKPLASADLGTGIVTSAKILDGTIANVDVNDVAASKLTGALPAISGASLTALPATLPASSGVNLTALNATNLGSGTVPTARLGSGTASSSTFLRGDRTYAEAGGGKVLQVLQAVKTDTQSFSGANNFQAITDLSLAITPAATSSKILITASVNMHSGQYTGGYSLFRGGSQVVTHSESIGSRKNVNSVTDTGDGNIMSNITFEYLDSPSSTSALTYQLYMYCRAGAHYMNRSGADGDSDSSARAISSMTAMEIGA